MKNPPFRSILPTSGELPDFRLLSLSSPGGLGSPGLIQALLILKTGKESNEFTVHRESPEAEARGREMRYGLTITGGES
jgi:hypothetical protein